MNLEDLDTFTKLTEIASNLGIGGGLAIWIYGKIHEKRNQDIRYLTKEIRNMVQFSDLCKDALSEAIENESTLDKWISETRSYSTHTSWNNFLMIEKQLNKPNDKKVKEILLYGKKIREALVEGRAELKKSNNEQATMQHQKIFTRYTKTVDIEFANFSKRFTEGIPNTSSNK